MIALLVLLAGFQGGCDDAVSYYHLYLSQHQMKDGSWGGWPAGCTCPHPPDPPAVAADPEVVRGWVAQLGDDDPERRDAAESRLRSLVEAALPALKEGAAHSDPEVRTRCERLRGDILTRSRGAGEVETTGLAILAFMGAGYTHLSRDTYEGVCFGDVVRNGLRWLLARQDASGRFDAQDPIANAVAALAVSEAYGLTGSTLWKDAAQRGVKAAESAAVFGPRALAWTALVAASARLSELEGAHAERAAAIVEALQEFPSLLATAVRAHVRLVFSKEKSAAVADELARTVPADLDPEIRLFVAGALYGLEGPTGTLWREWGPRVKEALVPRQRVKRDGCERGSWVADDVNGRLRATALNGLALQVYYRYWNQFFMTK